MNEHVWGPVLIGVVSVVVIGAILVAQTNYYREKHNYELWDLTNMLIIMGATLLGGVVGWKLMFAGPANFIVFPLVSGIVGILVAGYRIGQQIGFRWAILPALLIQTATSLVAVFLILLMFGGRRRVE
jgi:hypothetical protein